MHTNMYTINPREGENVTLRAELGGSDNLRNIFVTNIIITANLPY